MKRELRKKIEQQLADNRRQVEEYLRNSDDHKKPTTRRDFLRIGVIQSMGIIMAPSILNLLGNLKVAQAAECATDAGGAMVPYININMTGGWSMAGNWAPFDAGDQPLPSYSTLAQGASPTFTTTFANNARFFNGQGRGGSKFIEALTQEAGAAVLAKAAFVGVPCRSTDDTSNNRMDISGLVVKAGAAGSKLPNMAERNSTTGQNQQAAFNINPPAPLVVRNFTDITSSLGYAGALGQLNADQQIKLTELVKNLSDSQARSLASLSGGQNISDLVECATGKNVENMKGSSTAAVDPRNSATVASIWPGMPANANQSNATLVDAAMVFNCLNGLSGPIGLEIGGCDYHGQSRANQDNKDASVGKLVGQILRTAQALNKKVFISLTSDGSVSASGTNAGDNFTGDSGSRGCSAFIAFDPSKAPTMSGSSIGNFTTGQVADTSFLTGGSAEISGAAILLNWAKFSGDMNAGLKALPSNTFSTAQLAQIIKVA